MNLEFRKYPKDINLRDVKVVFSSDALVDTLTFDWHFIAPLAMVKKKTGGWGRIKAEGFASHLDPRLKYPFDIRFPLKAKTELPPEASLVLRADLYWGGKKQDSVSKSIRYLYKKK